jgi:cytochrome o ubiquinol oxidase subunit 2
VPLAIIICLAGLTWVATHRLDPYKPLSRISADQAIDPEVQPLVVQVAAMDWKWLFIYPEQGIATVNELAAVVDRPIEFQLTSTTVMNSFYVPALAGMIYTMNGLQTELNAVINEPGL